MSEVRWRVGAAPEDVATVRRQRPGALARQKGRRETDTSGGRPRYASAAPKLAALGCWGARSRFSLGIVLSVRLLFGRARPRGVLRYCAAMPPGSGWAQCGAR
jgi:hypothetical protein